MNEHFYFTRAANHAGEINGVMWRHTNLVEVIADSPSAAIDHIKSLVGNQWSHWYFEHALPKKERDEYFPDGVCLTIEL